METNIASILDERGKRYGDFKGHATITMALKNVLREYDGMLNDSQREALDMIVHKIGRILNGDPNYADSWVDIAGYAKLVADQLSVEQSQPEPTTEKSTSFVGGAVAMPSPSWPYVTYSPTLNGVNGDPTVNVNSISTASISKG